MSKKRSTKKKPQPRIKAAAQPRQRCPICFRYKVIGQSLAWECVITEHNQRIRQIMRAGEDQPDYDPDQYMLLYGNAQIGFHALHPIHEYTLCHRTVRVGELPEVIYARPSCPECLEALAKINEKG